MLELKELLLGLVNNGSRGQDNSGAWLCTAEQTGAAVKREGRNGARCALLCFVIAPEYDIAGQTKLAFLHSLLVQAFHKSDSLSFGLHTLPKSV